MTTLPPKSEKSIRRQMLSSHRASRRLQESGWLTNPVRDRRGHCRAWHQRRLAAVRLRRLRELFGGYDCLQHCGEITTGIGRTRKCLPKDYRDCA